MGGLLAGCIVAAVVTASQRWFFEKYARENYASLSGELRSVADAAARGTLDDESFDLLDDAERVALYDDWMSRSATPPSATPRALVRAAPELYVARVERSLVCGRPEQRQRALEFLELARCRDAIPMLQQVSRWAAKRNLADLPAQIQQTIQRLEQAAAADPPVPNPVPFIPLDPAKEQDHERQ
jgi:hypothetical protein